MEQQIIENGGLQYVPQIAVQYVYLDFDGELTSYNGEILTIDNVEVQDSSLTGERIADIVAELNARYAAQNVIFLTERPETAEYSTIYIGKTSAFDEYGNFAGLAETIDEGNQIKNDNAFVMLDSTAGDAQIISTISHETDHLLGTLDHGGEGLNTYARKILVNTKNNEVPIQYIYNTQGYNSCEEEISVIVWCIENSNKKQVYQGNFKTKKETRKYGTTYYWLPKNYITINVADFVKELPDIIDETITLSVGYDYNPELNAVNTLGTFFLKFVDRIFDQEKNRTNGVIDAKEKKACFIAAAVNALDFFKKINDGDYEKLVEYYGTKASTLGGKIEDILKSGGLTEHGDYDLFTATESDKIQNWLDNGYAVLMHHSGDSMGHAITIDSISGNEVKYTDSDDGKVGKDGIRNGNIKIDNNKYIFTNEEKNKYEITGYTVIYNGDNWSINTLLNKKNVHSEVSMSSAENITIGTGGKVNFNGPSTISGYIDMYDGGSLEATAAVTGTSDSEINISLAYDSPGSKASIYNLNNFSDINVSITVDGYQKHGEYLIATNASGFDRDISLRATYIVGNMGEILLNSMPSANFETFDEISMSIGSTVTNGNGVYELFLNDENNLILKVAYRSILNDNMAPDAPHLFSTEIFGYDATLSWQAVVDNGDAGTAGYYVRYGMTQTLNGEGVFVAANEFKLTNLAIGNYYYQVKSIDAAENISEWSAVQSFEVSSKTIVNLYGSVDGVSWDAVPGIHDYIVQYSKDNFINTLQIKTESNAVDTFGLPAGTYQWRVKGDGEFVNGENIVSDNTAAPQNLISDGDDDMDVFFANADGKWSAGYAAEHHGVLNGWTGTKEQINLTGKNKIADVFSGSDDANVLVLTDDINGDALFVEDIYTSFGKDAARISQIDEIRAGSGDDIIDMTSQKFAYTGEEMTIRGGLGNDVIWAAGGDNDLFGDAGNDRIIGSTGFDLIVGGAGNDSMHTGGGGNDIFAFCENWGQDTVQLTDSDSYIALWFASGSESNWDAAARIYSDGSNSVTVIGGAGCTIDLKFGDEGGQYDDMVSIGAFESATSEKIFEDKNSGMLA